MKKANLTQRGKNVKITVNNYNRQIFVFKKKAKISQNKTLKTCFSSVVKEEG